VEAKAQQLTFDFFAESRVEELALFRERTAAVADKMDGVRRETYLEASRRVAVRFSMSVSMSGAALSGYGKASETLPEADDATFGDFMSLVNDALANVDEIMNQIFELLGDFFSGDGDLQTRLDQFLTGLSELGLFGAAPTDQTSPVGPDQAQAFQFSLQLEFQFEYSETVKVQQAEVQESDPIVLDLDGDGFELTSHVNGAKFDIQGTGAQSTTAFVTGGDAFLAIDRNGNGTIDSGRELFGDQLGAANGYEELRKLDSNGDGRINSLDKDFDDLLLFRDNGNGITEDGELVGLAEAGVAEISLGYQNVRQVAAGGNRLAQLASFTRSDGSRGRAADAVLNFTV
jgi:hypothetical protein